MHEAQHAVNPPPNDAEAERALLGAILLDSTCHDRPEVSAVQPRDLYVEQHRLVLSAILDLRSRGIAVDITTVYGALADAGQLGAVDGGLLLKDLLEEVPHANHADHYAARVRRLARRRRKLVRVQEAEAMLRDPQSDDGAVDALLVEDEGDRDAERERFEWWTAAALASANHDIPWRVEDLLVADQPAIIGGQQKTLKTLLTLDLLISLATGSLFLGRFRPVEAVACGLMSGESGASNLAEAVRRIAKSKGILPSRILRLHISCDLPSLSSDADLAAVESYIRQHDLKVLAIDCAYLAMPDIGSDAGNLFIVGRLLRKLTELMNRTGCLIVLLHHFPKRAQSPGQPPELGELQYGGFAQWSGQHILLSRRTPFDPESGRHELWLSYGGRSGQSGLFAFDVEEGLRSDPGGRRWDVTLAPASQARREEAADRVAARDAKKQHERDARDNRDRAKVLKALNKHLDGTTITTLRTMTGIEAPRLRVLLADLIETCEAEACSILKPHRKTPVEGFRPATGSRGMAGSPTGSTAPTDTEVGPVVVLPCKGGTTTTAATPTSESGGSPTGPDDESDLGTDAPPGGDVALVLAPEADAWTTC